MVHENRGIPYFMNIVDQHRSRIEYNRGNSYNMMSAGPGWMSRSGRWEADYAFLLKSYGDGMAHYGQLKREGNAVDLTMSEFADVYRKDRPYAQPECTLWKDILYGSRRQHLWYADLWMRFCLDMNEGGVMIDLRPYAAKLVRPCGVGTSHIQDALRTHSSLNRQCELDTSLPMRVREPSRAASSDIRARKWICALAEPEPSSPRKVTPYLDPDPVEIQFKKFTIGMRSVFRLTEGTREMLIIRKIVSTTESNAKVTIDEYVTACYGTTEYPDDLMGARLTLKGTFGTESIDYAYRCREAVVKGVEVAEAIVP